MSHEDKQQHILIAETAATQLGDKHRIPDLLKHFLSLLQQGLVRLLVIIFLVHQPVESVEECRGVGHRFRLVNIRLILPERFQHSGGHSIAERLTATRSTEIVLGFEHIYIIGESQNLCGATSGILGDFRNHYAAVLTAVDKHGQHHYLRGGKFQLARGIPNVCCRLFKKFFVKVRVLGKFNNVLDRF